MSYYENHLFFCLNERDCGKQSCGGSGALAILEYAKLKVGELGLRPRLRVNRAGCLGRCQQGPCVVHYPAGNWYGINSEAEVDCLLNAIITGQPATQLLLPDKEKLSLTLSNPTKMID